MRPHAFSGGRARGVGALGANWLGLVGAWVHLFNKEMCSPACRFRSQPHGVSPGPARFHSLLPGGAGGGARA